MTRNDILRSPYPQGGFNETRTHKSTRFQYGAIYFGEAFAGRYVELNRKDGRRLFYVEIRT